MSVINVWRDDLLKFCPGISVHIHHGAKEKRIPSLKKWRENLHISRSRFLAKSYNGARKKKEAHHIHVVLTTYEVVMKDCQLLRRQNGGPYKWAYLVVRSP